MQANKEDGDGERRGESKGLEKTIDKNPKESEESSLNSFQCSH